jgi:hypothetical protein
VLGVCGIHFGDRAVQKDDEEMDQRREARREGEDRDESQ